MNKETYLPTDQPEQCPKCGSRCTLESMGQDGERYHCTNCNYRYIVDWDKDDVLMYREDDSRPHSFVKSLHNVGDRAHNYIVKMLQKSVNKTIIFWDSDDSYIDDLFDLAMVDNGSDHTQYYVTKLKMDEEGCVTVYGRSDDSKLLKIGLSELDPEEKIFIAEQILDNVN